MGIPTNFNKAVVVRRQAALATTGVITFILASILAVTMAFFQIAPLIPISVLGYAYVYSAIHILPSWLLRCLAGQVYSTIVVDLAMWCNLVFVAIDTFALFTCIYDLIFMTPLSGEFVSQFLITVLVLLLWLTSLAAFYVNSRLIRLV